MRQYLLLLSFSWGSANPLPFLHLLFHLLSLSYNRFQNFHASTYSFLTLQWCKSNTYSVETVLEIWNFDLLPCCRYAVGRILSHEAGLRRRAAAPRQPRNHKGKKPSTYSHSVPRQPSCFSLSVQYSINYMTYSTLYYKIGFFF